MYIVNHLDKFKNLLVIYNRKVETGMVSSTLQHSILILEVGILNDIWPMRVHCLNKISEDADSCSRKLQSLLSRAATRAAVLTSF